MKISILTATYNRANLLERLYKSIIENINENIESEWIISDDGSTDNTQDVVTKFINENIVDIKYFKHENKGKMEAINMISDKATGDLIIECDSDDYFTNRAFEVIYKSYVENRNEKYYGLCFLKYDEKGHNMGNMFKLEKTKMFDLYFKQSENGEKALVFDANIRKQYKYELEKNEKFVTEARMFHKMDEKYDIICINEPIMICEYQDKGYTRNIDKQFIENPYGYFEYFKEILNKNMYGVKFKKRIYAIKHFILFSVLINYNLKNLTNDISNKFNKMIIYILYLPGKIITKWKFKGMNR